MILRRSFTFNNVKKEWIYILQEVERKPFAPVNRNLIKAPGMDGAYLSSTKVDPLVFKIPVGFVVDGDAHALDLKDQLASWLYTNEPAPLQFDDEPGRTYFAVVQNTMEDFKEYVRFKRGTIQFLCVDPFGYSQEKQATFPNDAAFLTNNGTAEADPIFRLEATKPASYALIQNQFNEFMMIGKPVEVDSVEAEPRTTILDDTMNSLVGWGTASSGIIDGAISGTMMADDYRFYTTDYGTGSSWHGPAVIKSLSETLTDFSVEVNLEILNTQPTTTGRAEVYLVDSANNVVGKIGMKNIDQGSNRNYAEIRIGDSTVHHYLIHDYGGTESTWANFYGVLRLSRRGNEWSAYVARIDENGNHQARMYEVWEDKSNQFTGDIASVVAHLGQAGNKPVTTNRLHHIKVFRLNDLTENQIPYIMHEDDVLELDHAKEVIRINGEVRKDLKQFGASYFKLRPGYNQLYVFPENTFETDLSYMERFK